MIISAYKNITRRKFRSLLTMSSIAIGVFSMTIITIIGDIGKASINYEMESMGVNGICISANTVLESGFSGTDLQLISDHKNVIEATPFSNNLTTIEIKNTQIKAMVWGVDSNVQNVVSMELLYGRLITKADVSSNARVCVVDKEFAQNTYGRENIVSKTLTIQVDGINSDFEIIGVVETGGNILSSLMGDIVPTFMYIPYTTSSGFSQIIAKLEVTANEENVATQLGSQIGYTYGVENAIRYENLNKQKDNFNMIVDIITMILTIIGSISLLVAGLSIMTVMTMTVTERTKEIGIKKSIGAKKLDILAEFLLEALLLSLFGSIIGAGIGVLTCGIVCYIMNINLVVNTTSIGFFVIFSLVTSLIFGIYPALKASSLNPVEALRL